MLLGVFAHTCTHSIRIENMFLFVIQIEFIDKDNVYNAIEWTKLLWLVFSAASIFKRDHGWNPVFPNEIRTLFVVANLSECIFIAWEVDLYFPLIERLNWSEWSLVNGFSKTNVLWHFILGKIQNDSWNTIRQTMHREEESPQFPLLKISISIGPKENAIHSMNELYSIWKKKNGKNETLQSGTSGRIVWLCDSTGAFANRKKKILCSWDDLVLFSSIFNSFMSLANSIWIVAKWTSIPTLIQSIFICICKM